MCTSIYTETKDRKHVLARTMDYSFPLDFNVVYLPRNYSWKSSTNGVAYQSKYGFSGAGRSLGTSYFVADGVNEEGLAIAELYLPQKAVYQKQAEEGKINLAPHEFITWALGAFKSIADLKKKIAKVNLMDVAAPLIDTVTPLHWIITDTTGQCVVIEPTQKMLHLKENPIGVMTNTPCLEWHIENLSNYLNVRPKQYESAKFGDYTANPFSQGTGTMGLPGGYTPPERFVRAAFFKEHIDPAKVEMEAVTNSIKILSTVQIPKGIVVTANDGEDYSQYTGMMCNESKSYYYADYNNTRISKVEMTKELLERTTPKIFVVKKTEDIDILNQAVVSLEEKADNVSEKVQASATLLDMLGQEVLAVAKDEKNGTFAVDSQERANQVMAELGQLKSKFNL